MLTTIRLEGALAEHFPEELKADVATPREALSFLEANFPDFKSHILNSKCHYSLTCIGDGWSKELRPSMVGVGDFPIKGKTLVISPVLEGAGGDFFNRFFTPILLVGVGFLTGNTALLIGGLTQGLQSILFGYPAKPSEEKRSVNFQGGSPRTAEGTPIPIGIGSRVKVKDVMILSYGIVSEYTDL